MASLTSYDATLSAQSHTPPKLVQFSKIEEILTSLLSSPETIESTIIKSQACAFQLASNSANDNQTSSCSNLPIQTIGQPPNPSLSHPSTQMCIKTGYAAGDSKIVSKVAAGGGNVQNTGCVMVYSQQTLRLECILCDEGLLTEVRTAAAGAYVTKSVILFAGGAEKVRKVGVIGGGVQAVWQLRLLFSCGAIGPETKIVIKTRSRESAQNFMDKMKTSTYALDQEMQFEFFDEERRFKDCQVVYTLTPSRQTVLHQEDVTLPNGEDQPFLHITAIGSDSPGKFEVATDLLEQADMCLVDLIDQSHERGEFQSSRWNEPTRCPKLTEVGNNSISETAGMLQSEDRVKFTVFDSSGLAMQDVQMAKLISQHLQ